MDWFERAKEIQEENKETGVSYSEISKQLNEEGFDVTYEAVKKRFYRETLKENKMLEISKPTEPPAKIKNKVLIMADLHIPFEINECVEIIKKHRNEISALVLGGDILDCHEISSFPSIEHYPLEEELIRAVTFFKQIREMLPNKVRIIAYRGNHEDRLKMFIAKAQLKGMYKFLNPNILEMITEGFTVYENGVKKKYDGVKGIEIIDSWYVNINDELISCHPKNFSKIEGKSCKTAIEYFITTGEKFSTVLVHHTHHQAEVPKHLGKYGVETGCLCKEMSYADARTGMKKQENGYYIAAFDDKGRLDKNSSRLYTIDKSKDRYINKINLEF